MENIWKQKFTIKDFDNDNDYDLPSGDYELAYLVQDRMFKENGDLFFPF